MKMTVDISDALVRKAKKLAGREGTTLKALVERGLHRVIAEAESPSKFKLRKGSVKGNGLRPELRGVSWDRIRDLIYEESGR